MVVPVKRDKPVQERLNVALDARISSLIDGYAGGCVGDEELAYPAHDAGFLQYFLYPFSDVDEFGSGPAFYIDIPYHCSSKRPVTRLKTKNFIIKIILSRKSNFYYNNIPGQIKVSDFYYIFFSGDNPAGAGLVGPFFYL